MNEIIISYDGREWQYCAIRDNVLVSASSNYRHGDGSRHSLPILNISGLPTVATRVPTDDDWRQAVSTIRDQLGEVKITETT